MEDCEALSLMYKVLLSISENNYKGKYEIAYTKDLLAKSQFTFLVNESAFPEMNFINDCAYFDYQRDKVHARKNKQLKKAIEKHRAKKKSFYKFKPNTFINISANECPYCQGQDFKQFKSLSRKVADLKFSAIGVKRHIIEYRSGKFLCRKCGNSFIPPDYKKITLRVGHGLIIWTIYQHVVNNQSFRRMEDDLLELFGLSISRATLFACKKYFIDFYLDTYNALLSSILKGGAIYADETPFLMQFEKGYGWVFTNNVEVISFYKTNREGTFLKDFLKDFNGVLVSDFYSVYDSIDCFHQKCLIHLIRDFNSDLIRNPFNEEFKTIAKDFTIILQDIVSTIDKRGLKQYFLNKHIKSASSFLRKIKNSTYVSETAKAYQKRILKNKNSLFEFLNHDDVSWNNNNAEHAIKLLALHANKNMNTFRASRIDDYLKIISIYQTCEYRNISFLKFLLSKETNLDDYCNNLLGNPR